MPLTDETVRKLKPRALPYEVFDGGLQPGTSTALYIEVAPSGRKFGAREQEAQRPGREKSRTRANNGHLTGDELPSSAAKSA
jgi:hypothetical protein